MKGIILPAKLAFLYEAITYVSDFAKQNNFIVNNNHLELSVEEIFVNISSYAYQGSEGKVEITCFMEANSLVIQFSDSGVAYNPLEKQDPDISLPADSRPVGGLGIYLVKNCMDFVGYERRTDKNILTLKMNGE